jgi:hypothetical protein
MPLHCCIYISIQVFLMKWVRFVENSVTELSYNLIFWGFQQTLDPRPIRETVRSSSWYTNNAIFVFIFSPYFYNPFKCRLALLWGRDLQLWRPLSVYDHLFFLLISYKCCGRVQSNFRRLREANASIKSVHPDFMEAMGDRVLSLSHKSGPTYCQVDRYSACHHTFAYANNWTTFKRRFSCWGHRLRYRIRWKIKKKKFLRFIKRNAMKTYGGVEVQSRTFLLLAWTEDGSE